MALEAVYSSAGEAAVGTLFPEVAVMTAWNCVAVASLVVGIGLSVPGCGARPQGAVEESSEFTFDQIAAAAAAESAEAQQSEE